MKDNKKILVMSTLLIAIVLSGIGTIAYFRRIINSSITSPTGNLVLVVNEANAVLNESFEVILQRSEEENFIMPDDKGVFDLNIDSTGSSDAVEITITISRTNLPDNLKFYIDEEHTKELTTRRWGIEKSESMVKTIPIYWFWVGSKDDINDSDFINKTISANISVIATIKMPFIETLYSQSILDTNVDFSLGASETNGKGLMMREGTQNDEYPIVYYRGDVTNNNIIFVDLCWLIVRTTETGGIKLIYNGEVNEDGSCNNYSGVGGEDANSDYLGAYIDGINYKFNKSSDSPVYVGYMYNDDIVFDKWNFDGTGYITHLSDNSIDSETGRHNQNKYDSTAKEKIDIWYEKNIKDTAAEKLLEDTIWCNDRSVTSTTYSIENFANSVNYAFAYSAGTRLFEPEMNLELTISPNLDCEREIDKFTIESANGNGDLTYPIGMLTADEIMLTGSDLNTYLYLMDGNYWSISPNSFTINYGWGTFMYSMNKESFGEAQTTSSRHGLRPSISLGLDIEVNSGVGSFADPYVVS